MKKISLLIFLISVTVSAQVDRKSTLFKQLKKNDSIVFNASFRTCNLKELSTLIMDDLEFYHDKAGVMSGKETFINNTKNGLCKSTNDLNRELDASSLEVFPMYKTGGDLYAAIQKGVHFFYENGKKVGVARFTHLWVLNDKKWMLKRVLSYDHKSAN